MLSLLRRRFALAAAVLLVAVPAIAAVIHNLVTATTTPMPVNSCIYVDQGPGTDTAACQDQDTYWGRLFKLLSTATGTKTGNYPLLGADTGTTFDNTGASGEVDFTLPTEGNNLNYSFCVMAAQTLKVIAPASTKIAVGASNSAAAGNITANAIGACVWLYSPNGATTQWVAKSSTGTWTVN